MTRVVFETATIRDAIKAAEKVAPNKGQAFDKAAGIILEVNPPAGTVVVRSTNMEIFHMAWIDTVEMEGDPVIWRVPSRVFNGVVGSLPIASGNTMTLEQIENRLHLSAKPGRTKAQFGLIDHEYYPTWPAFDPDGLIPATDLGGRIAQVEWAAAKTGEPLNGVHLDGKMACSTDKYRLAITPLKIDGLDEGITVPAGVLGQILKQTGEVMIGVDGVGDTKQLLIMPDEHTQVRAIVFGLKYPKVNRIAETHRAYPAMVRFDKTELLELVSRASHFEEGNRVPTLQLILGNQEIAVFMQERDRGLLGDVLEVPGQIEHPRVRFNFTPRNFTDIFTNCPNDKVVFGYNPDKPTGLVYCTDEAGYEAWAMPRIETGEGS